MNIPVSLQQSIDSCLQIVGNNSYHTLLPKNRVQIYKNPDLVSLPYYLNFFGWLSFLSAKFVAPLWEQEVPQDDIVERMLTMSEGFLNGTIHTFDVRDELELFYNATGNAYDEAPGAAGAVLGSAYAALMCCQGYIPFKEISPKQVENGLPDELLASWRADAASYSVMAYSGYAYREEILFNRKLYATEEEMLSDFLQSVNTDFEPTKRKYFWEWWLLEAIPQAWKLAN
jgi:hypothetical protein